MVYKHLQATMGQSHRAGLFSLSASNGTAIISHHMTVVSCGSGGVV
jgi:hypothetical protein